MTTEIPKWPGPGPEEWWWRQPECSPRTFQGRGYTNDA
jgi:hypothetical protein